MTRKMNKHQAAYVRKKHSPLNSTMPLNYEPIFDPFPHILQTTVVRNNKPMTKKMKKQTWVKNVFGDETYYYEAGIKK